MLDAFIIDEIIKREEVDRRVPLRIPVPSSDRRPYVPPPPENDRNDEGPKDITPPDIWESASVGYRY